MFLVPSISGRRLERVLAQVIDAVEAVTDCEVPRTYHDRRPGDPPILVADAARARELLGWTPKRSTLDQMIGSAWDWMQRNPDGYGDSSIADGASYALARL